MVASSTMESSTTKWTGEGGLLMPKTQEGPQDMDVGYLGSHQKGKKGKGKDGKGKKGKGKKGNPQYYEYQQKGKGRGKNGGWKGNAKGDKGGKAKGGKGECWNCGKTGHQAKDCWSKNVNRLEEESQAGSTANASSMASSSSASASGTATANVRMIRMFTPPDANETRIFDLTAGDDDEFMQSIMEVDESQIYMVEADEEQFHECMEPVVEDVGAASIVALDLQDGESDTVEEPEAENQMRLTWKLSFRVMCLKEKKQVEKSMRRRQK